MIDGIWCDVKIPDSKKRVTQYIAKETNFAPTKKKTFFHQEKKLSKDEITKKVAVEKARHKDKMLAAQNFGQFKRQDFLNKLRNSK